MGQTTREQRPGKKAGDTARTLRWERAMYWPLTAAALVFLITYTLHVLHDVHGPVAALTSVLMGLSYLMFLVDYVCRLLLSRPRRVWVRTHLFDLAVVLAPPLRPLRLFDAVTRLPVFTRTRGDSIRSRLLIYGSGSALILIWYLSLSVLSVERHAPGATITSFGDALWWAFCTVTTVGYGDMAPVTTRGRLLAVALMIGGVILVGLVVATFSSYVMERVTRGRDDQIAASRADLRALQEALQTWQRERREAAPHGGDEDRPGGHAEGGGR